MVVGVRDAVDSDTAAAVSIFFGVGSIAIITYPLPIGCRLKPLIMVIWTGLVRVLSPGLSDRY
jgi:hypothetical protein